MKIVSTKISEKAITILSVAILGFMLVSSLGMNAVVACECEDTTTTTEPGQTTTTTTEEGTEQIPGFESIFLLLALGTLVVVLRKRK